MGHMNIPRTWRVGSFLKEDYDTVNGRGKNEGQAEKYNRYSQQARFILFSLIEIFLFFPFYRGGPLGDEFWSK